MEKKPENFVGTSLLTDLYQLTMAYGYWKQGMQDRESVFHLFFRKNPFRGGYTIAAGLAQAVQFLNNFGFTSDDIDYLRDLKGNDGEPLFEEGFLSYLLDLKFTCDLDGVPEGTVVFPHEPMLRIQGPLAQCQILETPLLNIMNFQTLIATKSNRICRAAKGDPVLEFGLRRAQGPDGSLSASRAAYIGGVSSTSNVLAGKIFGIPIKGTHAHSWVMSFDSEEEAFEKYSQAMPNNCVLLVDTYNTMVGVANAVKVAKKLQEHGHKMIGIRLDSGNLVTLSIQARKILDESGLEDASIVASNDLDEYAIARLKGCGAKIDVWGVGTRLVTAHDQPALGGVYKLAAIQDETGEWKYKAKVSSDDPDKASYPGLLQVRRYYSTSLKTNSREMKRDFIYHETMPPDDNSGEDVLIPIYRIGIFVGPMPSLEEIRERVNDQVEKSFKRS